MSLNFPLPQRTRLSYGPSSEDSAYGRYLFRDGDENGFLEHLMGLYPTLEWKNCYPNLSDWEHIHGENTISRYERVSLNNAFHSNSKEVQLEEIYQWLRTILDGWANCYHGRVVVWFVGFDVADLIYPADMSHRAALKLSLAVAFYPESEQ